MANPVNDSPVGLLGLLRITIYVRVYETGPCNINSPLFP